MGQGAMSSGGEGRGQGLSWPPASADAPGGAAQAAGAVAVRGEGRSAGPGAAAPCPDERIGPYEIRGVLGEGGFGVVYLAERREPIVQLVALKVIKPGMDSRAVIARFEQERQALAVMDHPNVARVFDAGTTGSGRPYFVMEHVPGRPITEYCDMHRLGVRERLALFIPVCAAVQHAHTKGIIHRDLKPSNILVSLRDGQAVPKVIDFGVAKALGGTLTDKTLCTEAGQLIGTLEYMSPEQADLGGLVLDTRTDVYSLGVVLYELLTGLLPFEPRTLTHASLDQIRRMIRETDPPRPSAAFAGPGGVDAARKRGSGPEELARQLRRELEWIPLKAMRKDPSQRYQSARELAADIENFLAGRALWAGPESAAYRVRKFARRHRLALGAAAALAGSLVLGIAGTTAGMLRAQREAERATTQAQIAQRRFDDVRALARSFIVDVEPLITELPGATRARKFLVDTGRDYLDRLAREAGDEPELLAELAYAYEAVGDVQGGLARANLGDVSGALESYLKAQGLHQRRVTLLPGDERTLHFLGISRSKVGDAMMQLGRQADALEQYRGAIGLFEELGAAGNPDMSRELAVNHSKAADALRQLGHKEEALAAYRENLAIFERLVLEGSPDSSEQARRDLAISHSRLGDMLSDMGRIAEAIQQHRRSLEISRELGALRPESTLAQRELGISHLSLGQLLVVSGRIAEAVEDYREGLRIFDALCAADPANADARMGVAYANHELAYALLQEKRAAEAIGGADAAVEAVRPIAAADPGNADVGIWMARCVGLAAEARQEAARDPGLGAPARRALLEEALAGYMEAQALWRALAERGAIPPGRVSDVEDLAPVIAACEKELAGLRE